MVLVDPPSGWMYGFPAPLQEDYEQQLKDAGYPEKDIPLALKHSRYMADTREELLKLKEKE
jgi:uncharacterized protein Smg (DUF494 family)